MSSHLRFDDGSDYDPTDSDDDYQENEKILLNRVRNMHKEDSDGESAVLGVVSDEDVSDIALSDVEGQEDDNLPNVRAWGKNKKKFYSTDYVDADYGGFQGQDAHLAELEEEEAKNLQQQLAQQLDDDDFSLDTLTNVKQSVAKEKDFTEESIKSDLSQLTTRQHLELLKKESPEFFGLVEDFQQRMAIVDNFLNPLLQEYTKGKIANSLNIEFVTTFKELILNYCTNIYSYVLLKASRVSIQNHPVVKRLYQFRQLLLQLDPIYENIVKPQLNSADENMEIVAEMPTVKEKSKKIKQKKLKTVKFNEDIVEVEPPSLIEAEEKDTDIAKRAITYKMAKNKGLTPHRKKEQRNPRVKHRNKFRKAKIRRKGAIRAPRTELSRYKGEISGINISVTKSIKIKT